MTQIKNIISRQDKALLNQITKQAKIAEDKRRGVEILTILKRYLNDRNISTFLAPNYLKETSPTLYYNGSYSRSIQFYKGKLRLSMKDEQGQWELIEEFDSHNEEVFFKIYCAIM